MNLEAILSDPWVWRLARSLPCPPAVTAGIRRPSLPGPAPLIKLAALPMLLLPEPPLTPDAVDFINAPATVDLEPLLSRMPRALTPLDAGLATYLAPSAGPVTVSIDAEPDPAVRPALGAA